ncbi:hypothetical protein NDU88_006309 [Pleurodeles waltl]|uniref:Uncharacterized protein n=1 Tax=Pleurodeles waltl TaxID=8319 RepID=A0AAV7TF58_PLEWA|nr:hypothetical protein NDU88_006309 [Pleurodeles waltl]
MEPELHILPALVFLLLYQEHQLRRRRPGGACLGGPCPVQRSLPCSAVLALVVLALFSGACPVQQCLPWRSLPCPAVLALAVLALFSSACIGGPCPVQQCLTCSVVLALAVLALFSGACIGGPSLPSWAGAGGPSLPSWAVAGGALLGSWAVAGGALMGSWAVAGGALLGSWAVAGGALLGSWAVAGGALLGSDDEAARDDCGLLRCAAPPTLCGFLLPLPHLGRSHSRVDTPPGTPVIGLSGWSLPRLPPGTGQLLVLHRGGTGCALAP